MTIVGECTLTVLGLDPQAFCCIFSYPSHRKEVGVSKWLQGALLIARWAQTTTLTNHRDSAAVPLWTLKVQAQPAELFSWSESYIHFLSCASMNLIQENFWTPFLTTVQKCTHGMGKKSEEKHVYSSWRPKNHELAPFSVFHLFKYRIKKQSILAIIRPGLSTRLSCLSI